MIIDKEKWTRFVSGFGVVGGMIGFDNSRYCFILEEKERNIHRDPPPKVRLLFARMERPLERRFYSIDFSALEFPRFASAFTGGLHEFVVCDMDGNTIVYNDVVADIGPEEPGIVTTWSDEGHNATVQRLKRVNGKMYAVCRDRRILERKGGGVWTEFPGLARPAERSDKHAGNREFGFADMDAYSPGDIYAVGGRGDVWHCNGTEWRRCNFPSDDPLETVCCAGDGKVYITGNRGSLWVGKGDIWKQLSEAVFSVSFNDTVWFADKLWCSNDYALYTLENDGLQPAAVADSVQLTTRRLDVSADRSLLLSAGKHGASLFDGKQWQLLFSATELG
jgi:hypothetical protein